MPSPVVAATSSLVFSVPTRIETSKYKGGRAGTNCVFSVPTRDWNLAILPYNPAIMWFLAYLRGIETIVIYILLEYLLIVFSVPTRDWNGIMADESDMRATEVFSVPTRDWNQLVVLLPKQSAAVFSVPTRDWNVFVYVHRGKNPKFLAYLRGIETSRWPRGYFSLRSVFSVPTRDWNLYGLVRAWLSLTFLAYLRGIETGSRPRCAWYVRTFLAYLRGIETSF